METISCFFVCVLQVTLAYEKYNAIYVSIPHKYNFKNTKNLFIHIALIPIGDSPRDITTF